MNLEATAEALENWTPTETVDLARREQLVERFGQFAFGGFGVVLILAVAGLIYAVFKKMILTGQEPWVGVLLIGFILFALLTLAYVVFNEDLKHKKRKSRPAPPNELQKPAVTGKLLEEQEFEPIPTVTENTTELLPVRDRERRR